MSNPWKDVSADEAYAEAQRRIAAARADGSTQLDLGDLPLLEMPPELGELGDSLQSLDLSRVYDYVSAEYEHPGFQEANLQPLAGLTALTSLDLSGCHSTPLTLFEVNKRSLDATEVCGDASVLTLRCHTALT